MRALVIDDKNKGNIAKLIEYAEAHKFSIDALKKMMSGDMPPAGDYLGHVITIDQGYRVVFSIEEQPIGWCRHLSISTRNLYHEFPGKIPDSKTVEMIMEKFGMGNNLNDCVKVWIEEGCPAVNVVTLKDSNE
jgi:hypothetical protein